MKSYLKGLAAALGLFLAANIVAAQVTVPNTFTPGTTISSSQMNANFATLSNALNRTGGTMTGTLTSQQITPSSTATYDIGTSLVKFRDLFLSRNLAVGGNATVTGTVTAGSGSVQLTDATGKIQGLSSTYFASVDGSALTSLNASNLASGTVPDARFPATLPAANGSNLTALNAGNLGSGTIPDARFPSTLPAVSGASLTNLNGSNVASGSVPSAYGGVPAGLIAFSVNGSCPTGWTEYTTARGRYIVGLVSGGTNGATVGTSLSNSENRATGQHTHTATTTITNPNSMTSGESPTGSGNATASFWGASNLLDWTATTTINNAGSVAGTNAPYVQLIACQKS